MIRAPNSTLVSDVLAQMRLVKKHIRKYRKQYILLTVIGVVAYVPISWLIYHFETDYVASLPNGFHLHRTNGYTTCIAKTRAGLGSDTFVAAKITQIAVVDNYVIGEVVDSHISEIAYLATPGWFVLDTVHETAVTGLSRPQWESYLKDKAVTLKDIDLIKPRHYWMGQMLGGLDVEVLCFWVVDDEG